MRLSPLANRRVLPLSAVANARLNPRAATARPGTWYTIRNAATPAGGGRAMIDIYGEIGYWGVEAAVFIAELRQLDAAELEIHLNSPGGDVYEGLAIYQALVDHQAHIEMRVDGLAASIASIIAQAGDRIIMGANAEMMIHDAWGLTVGNAEDHRRMADDLDRISDNLASVYATRSGLGVVGSWRQLMKDETWFSAQETVTAGLADEVSDPGRRGDPPVAAWRAELAGCRYLGRAAAPAPQVPAGARKAGPVVPLSADLARLLDSGRRAAAGTDDVQEREPGEGDAAEDEVGEAPEVEPAPAPAPDPEPEPEPEPEPDGPVALTVAAVLAALAAHNPQAPAPLVASDVVQVGLDQLAGSITADSPAPEVLASLPEPAPTPDPEPDPDPDPVVTAQLVTAAVDTAATTIVPDPAVTLSAEWVLAATKAAAALPGPDLGPPTAEPTNHTDDIRRNFLEVMLP